MLGSCLRSDVPNTVASRAQIDKVDSAPDGCCDKILARVIEGGSTDYHSVWYVASVHVCPASTAIAANQNPRITSCEDLWRIGWVDRNIVIDDIVRACRSTPVRARIGRFVHI